MYGSPVGKPPVTAYTSVGVCAQISDYMLPLHKAHLVLSVCVCVFVQKYELQFSECWKYNVRVCFSVHKGVCVCVFVCVWVCVRAHPTVHLFIHSVSSPHESLARATATCREEEEEEEEEEEREKCRKGGGGGGREVRCDLCVEGKFQHSLPDRGAQFQLFCPPTSTRSSSSSSSSPCRCL